MHHSRWTRRLALPGLFASLLIVIASWSAAGVDAVSYGSPAPSASPTVTPVPSSLQLGAGTSATLGSYLTGPSGLTLYTLSSDPTGGSACTGQCLSFWPPLLVAPGGTVTGPSGATGTLSTFTRADTGATQVTYDGRPLYYFSKDASAGQTNGQGIKALGGIWQVAALSGAPSGIQVGVATSATLGAYLTGPSGHALYTLSSDSTSAPACSGPCLVNWPPLLVAPGGSVTGAAGATGTFGTFVRADGTTQVTYDGHPVYYFAHDTAAGQTNGEGIAALGGVWHVALAAAAVATSTPSASPAASASLPPTSAAGGQTNGGPGGVPPLLVLILGLGAASIVAGTILSTAPRRR